MEYTTQKIRSYKDLAVWQHGHALVLRIYRGTQQFPKAEQFGLTSQMRRAAVSITSNIAEGFSRRLPKEKAQFYSVAKGSLTEVDNQMLIARDVGYISNDEYSAMVQQIEQTGRLLTGLLRATQQSRFDPYSTFPIQHSSERGYITLMSVLIVGAVGIAIALSLLLLGVGSARTSFAIEQSNQAKALVNACAEEALQQIRDSTPFTGTGSLTLGQGTCTYTVTSQGGSNRTITASGTVGTIIRKATLIISQINPSITITSWQEVE